MYEALIQQHFAGDSTEDIRRYIGDHDNLLEGELFRDEPGPKVDRLYALIEKLCSSFVYVTKVDGETIVSAVVMGDSVVRLTGRYAAFFCMDASLGITFIGPDVILDDTTLAEIRDLGRGLFADGKGNRRVMNTRDKYMDAVSAVVSERATKERV